MSEKTDGAWIGGDWLTGAEWFADNYAQQAYNLACSFGNDAVQRQNRDNARAALVAHLRKAAGPQDTLPPVVEGDERGRG